MYDKSFNEWKIVPLFYIKKTLGNNFEFYSNSDYKLITKFLLPDFYKNIPSDWTIHFTTCPGIRSCILNQVLCYNEYIQINDKTAYLKKFSLNSIIFAMDLLDKHGKLKNWSVVNMEYHLNNTFYFQ